MSSCQLYRSLAYFLIFKVLNNKLCTIFSHISLYFIEEAEVQFPPTYKYKKGDRLVYDWRKEKRTEVCSKLIKFIFSIQVLQNQRLKQFHV